ncbi:phosphatidylethanolamine-binding protein [Podospora appendiculata]|uniref:Large ribosomal subunit protein mL38 n=1 Tax=Podospora appendiculata TaxID=314037 RepID=A0AAE1C9S4_9PEZI|nr:phosphatidylethanolamine-binding protein [Podospora appendiculata]
MSRCQQVARPLVRSLRPCPSAAAAASQSSHTTLAVRYLSSTAARRDLDKTTTTQPGSDALDAALLGQSAAAAPQDTPQTRQQLAALGSADLGSRRRRAALATTGDIPFEQLPYQCFQEARKILNQDREEKIAKIVAETEKIKRLEAADASTMRGGEAYKQKRLVSLREHVEELKILADINDPEVKRRFENGTGDMSKPIYRYLANRRWRSMDHKIVVQRIEQFNIVPDLLPRFEPTMDVKMSFRGYTVSPGAVLDSRLTEVAPTLRMQVFDKGERLLTIVVLDSDVPDEATDGYARRCHFLAANVPWDPSKNLLSLRQVGGGGGELAVPWLPAFAQKGAPYHRLSLFVLEQKAGETLDGAKLKALYGGRDGFSLKSFRDKFGLTPVGFNLFRSEWDEGTAAVMEKHGIPGADVEFKRARVVSMKTPRAAKGWEAKRQGPKYKSLWKYTKRIKGARFERN